MDEVIDFINQKAKESKGQSQPGGWYSQDGDCLFYYNEDVPYHAVRLTNRITVFEALDDGRPIGIAFKGVRSLLTQSQGFRLLVEVKIARRTDLNLDYLLSCVFDISEKPAFIEETLLKRTFDLCGQWSLPAAALQPMTI